MLQERFVAGLDRRLTQLNAHVSSLRDAHDGSQIASTADELMRGFHSLAGIGGTYGFPQITDIARLGEQACRSLNTPVAEHEIADLSDRVMLLAIEAISAENAIYGHHQNGPPAHAGPTIA